MNRFIVRRLMDSWAEQQRGDAQLFIHQIANCLKYNVEPFVVLVRSQIVTSNLLYH
jgi:hypothetical protein